MQKTDTVTPNYAKVIIGVFELKGESITHLKLQKILYFLQGWHLAYFKTDPFKEAPEAWVHGPVYRSVYNEYRGKGFEPLLLGLPEETELDDLLETLPNFTPKLKEFILELITHYGSKSAFELEVLTHGQTPWINARKDSGPTERSTNLISRREMLRYFNSLLK